MLTESEQASRDRLKQNKPLVYEKVKDYDIKSGLGQSIAQIQFQYDYACNMGCEHCCITGLRRGNSIRHFTVEDVKELSKQADAIGLSSVVITGGEPLLFPEFDAIVKAFDPSKFYITSDTNGWLLDDAKAVHLKSIGVDRIQLSLDSLDSSEHDEFRRKPGSHAKCLQAIDACKKAGLALTIATVVTKQRIHSDEFLGFLEWAKENSLSIFVTYAKPVGAWAGKTDMLIDKEDMKFMQELEKTYPVCTHLTASYGNQGGCIAVKRIISITKYGDVMPCPYMHMSLGNFFQEPLKDILDRGMSIPCFGEHCDTCYIAEDRGFIDNINKKTDGKQLPVPYLEVLDGK